MPSIANHRLDELRRRAEQIIGQDPEKGALVSAREVEKLVHDVQVYQVELEMQNEELRQTQSALAGSRDQYMRLYNDAPAGYLTLDPSAVVVQVNRTFAQMLDLAPADIVNKPFSAWVDLLDRDVFLGRFRAFFNHPEQKHMELRLIGPAGQRPWVRLQGRRPMPADGEQPVDRLLVTVVDVSQSKRAEAALKTSLERLDRRSAELAAMLECTRAILHQKDFQTTARLIFDQTKALIGATAGYVALLSPAGEENEVLFLDAGGRPCTVDPELPMPIRGLREQAYRKAKAVYDNRFANSHWAGFLPDGHVTLNNVLFAPLVIDDKACGLIGLANKPGGFTDADAELAEAFGEFAAIALANSRILDALQASRERYRTVVETAVDAIVTMDRQGRIMAWNPAAQVMFGHGAMEIMGCALWTLIRPDPSRADVAELEKAIAMGAVGRSDKPYELVGLRNDGTFFDLELTLGGGMIRGESFFTAIVRDITARKQAEAARARMEQRLRHSQKMAAIGTLSGGIAHNFNNIMSIVMGNTELALMDIPPDHPASNFLDEVLKAGGRARDLVSQLLIYTRGSDAERRPLDPVPVVSDALALIQDKIPANIVVRAAFQDRLPMVLADPGHLHQVVANLCDNAIHAMEQNGGILEVAVEAVTIPAPDPGGAAAPSSYLRLIVRDNGCGIARHLQDRVMDPFFTTKPVDKGRGLGLTVVQGIVRQCRGTIRFDSQPRQGTVVEVLLPEAIKEKDEG